MSLYVKADHLRSYSEGLPNEPLCIFSGDRDLRSVVSDANRAAKARDPQFEPPYAFHLDSAQDDERWRIENDFAEIQADWVFLFGCRLHRTDEDYDTESWSRFVLLAFRAMDGEMRLLTGSANDREYTDGPVGFMRDRDEEQKLRKNIRVVTLGSLTPERLLEIGKAEIPESLEHMVLDLIPVLAS